MHYGIDFCFLTRKGPRPKYKTFFRSLKGGPNFPNPRTPGVRKWTVTHSASGFWRHHLLDLSAWLLCSRLPPFIRVLKSTFDRARHNPVLREMSDFLRESRLYDALHPPDGAHKQSSVFSNWRRSYSIASDLLCYELWSLAGSLRHNWDCSKFITSLLRVV